MTNRPWVLPNRYPSDDEWYKRTHYEWASNNMNILEAIDKSIADFKPRKGQALAETLESKLQIALNRIAEIKQAVDDGQLSEDEGRSALISVGGWLKANGII